MTIRFGVSPIAWIDDDMPELGGDTPVEQVLEDARDIGFAGVELGGKFPRNPAELRKLLGKYQLELVGGWYSSRLRTRTATEEIEHLRSHLELLQSLRSSVFIIAETSNAIHGRRDLAMDGSPDLAEDEWKRFGERITAVAEHVDRQGLRLAYHHHLGTVVESASELEKFLRHTSDAVGLTLDTGHAKLGGIDPLQVVMSAPQRVVHVHCKDTRSNVFEQVAGRNGSFLDGVLEGMFTVPGDGDYDFAKFLHALSIREYSGWIVVEAEQDPAKANPRTFARLGLNVLRQYAALAGLKEAA